MKRGTSCGRIAAEKSERGEGNMKRILAVLLMICLLAGGAAGAEEDGRAMLYRNGIDLTTCIDSMAYSYIVDENDIDAVNDERADYLGWLAGELANRIVPSAANKLLQIPVYARAAEEGRIGRYITICLTHNESNLFGGLVNSIALNAENGNVHSGEETVYNMGYRIEVNVAVFGENTRTDENKLRELENTIIHELMHAFMYDVTRNAMTGADRNGNRTFVEGESVSYNPNVLPQWLGEGFAESVEAGFDTRRGDLLYFLGDGAPMERYLEIASDPIQMMNSLGGDGSDEADIRKSENAYSLGYVAALTLYNMAARAMGKDAIILNEAGNDAKIDKAVLFEGMNDILQKLVDGRSMDEIVKEISGDPDLDGEPRFQNLGEFEESCFRSSEDEGLSFWGLLMTDFLTRNRDMSDYRETGSVLPGYDNALEFYLDREPVESPVFQVVFEGNPMGGWEPYAVSTVRPSLLALGGSRSVSYDPEADALTEEEAEERDTAYIGDTVKTMVPDM